MRGCVALLLAAVVAVAGCGKHHLKQNLPPAERLMHPGPGVDGPGPGVMMYTPPVPYPAAVPVSQVAFVGPEGMTVTWDVGAPGLFDSEPVVAPARYNFPQGAIYRLKITSIPGRPGVELYPTLEIAPAMPRTEAFLAHNAIPVQLTEEDLDQVLTGNFVTKVIYLPDPEFQELALAGVETLVSTRLDPGVDPIVEADRRGSILAILRLGNKDLEIPAEPAREEVVNPASYNAPVAGAPMAGAPCPVGTPVGVPPTVPPTYIAGVTGPQYGMPYCGTPIGLPGPPHVPLGIPAGLQRHVVKNHTKMHIPGPTSHVKIDVKQKPGMSYPKPANHARVVEKTHAGPGVFRQPASDRRQVFAPTAVEGPCPPAGYLPGPDCPQGCPVGDSAPTTYPSTATPQE